MIGLDFFVMVCVFWKSFFNFEIVVLFNEWSIFFVEFLFCGLFFEVVILIVYLWFFDFLCDVSVLCLRFVEFIINGLFVYCFILLDVVFLMVRGLYIFLYCW